RRERAALASQRSVAIAGALGVVIYPLAFYSSMHLAGVAVGTVVSLGSAPIASGLVEWIVERRRLSGWWMLAAGLGIAGSAVLCPWAAHRLMSRGIGRAAAMGSVFGLGGLALMPVLAVTGSPLLASPSAFAVGTYMGLVPMFLGYVLFGFGLTRVTVSTATTLTLAEPAVAAVLAVVVVGERLPFTGWLGLAGIGVSLLILAVTPMTLADALESRSSRSLVRQEA